jgi:hypothetical protein
MIKIVKILKYSLPQVCLLLIRSTMVVVTEYWLLDKDHPSDRRRRQVHLLGPASHLEQALLI